MLPLTVRQRMNVEQRLIKKGFDILCYVIDDVTRTGALSHILRDVRLILLRKSSFTCLRGVLFRL